jgi:uncharacterized repeat protein (TIGR01451 family)
MKKIVDFKQNKREVLLKSFLATFIFLISYCGFGQVSYHIGLDADKITYRVYMKSAVSYTGIQAKISTSQVTIVVPHGIGINQFQVANLIGKTAGSNQMNWGVTRVDAPSENTLADYISFGYSGSGSAVLFDIPAGQEIELFNFKNTGNCIGAVNLIENTDPFMNNATNINPGNQITILGYGQNNAYQNNYGGSVSCQTNAGVPDLTASIVGSATLTTNIATNYTINVNNIGNAATTGSVNVNTTLPAGVTYNTTSGNGWASTATLQGNGTTLVSSTFSGSIAANGSITPLVLNVTPTNLLPSGTVITISGSVSGGGENNISNNNFTTNSTIAVSTANADLGVAITLSNQTPNLGNVINYTFQITNNGANAASNVTNQIVLPNSFSVSNANAAAGTYNQFTGVWSIPTISVGQTYTLTISGSPTSAGVFYATSQITASGVQDNNTSNNSSALCYGVPVKLCSGATFVARIDKKYTNIQWFKNSTAIQGATADTLLINSAGTYTFTSSVNCPQSGCCPIVVTTGQISTDLGISPTSVNTCGNYNLTNLTISYNGNVVNNGLAYYATQADATAGTNPISTFVTQSGAYWVRYSPLNACPSIGVVNITISSALSFTQPSPMCAKTFDLSSIALYNNGVLVTSGIKYYATFNNSPSSVVIIPLDNPVVSASGTYYATVTNPNGCVSLATINVNLLTIPATPNVQDATNICPANSVNLVSLQPNPSTYGGVFEWHIANSATSPMVITPTAVSTGNYYIFEKSTAGCYSLSDVVKATIADCCSSPDCLPFRLVKVKLN